MSIEGEGSLPSSNPPGQAGLFVKRKKNIRAGYRAHTRKLLGESNTISNAENPNKTDIERIALGLRDKLKVLRDIDQEIFELINDEEIENEVMSSEEWQSEIHGSLLALEAKKSEVSRRNDPTVGGSQSSPVVSAPAASPQENPDQIAMLPKLFLPKYSGDPKKWQEFWDSFEIIHGNSSLSPVNKLRHLKTLLEGEAAAAISGISTEGANYDIAVKILKDRFAQKQIIVNSHVEALMNLRGITTDKDVKGLRKLVDEVETNIRSLQTLGYDLEQYGPFLTPMIMSKLPDDIRLAVTKLMHSKEWELGTILEHVKAELHAREQCAHLKSKPDSITSTKPIRQPHTTSALLGNVNKITCTFCKNSHPSVKCHIVTDTAQRKEILRKQGRCFVCLKKGHILRECPSRILCFICKQRHHSSVCESRQKAGMKAQRASEEISNSQQWQANSPDRDINPSYQGTTTSKPAFQTTTTMYVESKTSVLLQTAKGYVSSTSVPENIDVARLVLDSGSKHSYITERLRDKLKLPTITQETLTIKVFGAEEGTLQKCDVVQFCVRSSYDGQSAYVTAYVVPVLCAPLADQAINFAVNNYPHLERLRLADFPAERNEPLNCDILIGSNYYWHFLSGRCIRGEDGPVALESILGWILSGPVHDNAKLLSTQIYLAETHVLKLDVETNGNDNTLNDQLSKFWNLESIGIKGNEATVYQSFEDEIEFVEGRYQIKLPWKPEHATLPDNFQLSKRRLCSNYSKLKANPKLLQEYNAIIKDQEQQGIIERVDIKQECEIGKTTYLPHHPVIRQDKTTTKVRVVFDASAKDRSGTSLNSCLYTGPCLLKTVVEIMTRFRLYPIALTADIEMAFLMISVWPPDRDALRFLWLNDINAPSPQTVIYRFARVVFGVSCSPFLLNATLKGHIEGYFDNHPEECSRLVTSLYADDVNAGGYTEAEVIKLYTISKQIMKDGGFNLRKWLSNSKEVMSEIKAREVREENKPPMNANTVEDDQSFAKTSLKQTELSDDEGTKVLGLTWNTETDTFIFNLENSVTKALEAPVTKRTILGMIAKIYDPLGLITPITSPLKVFLQKLFQANKQWDETLSDDLANEWNSLLSRIEHSRKISIPRYYFGNFTDKPPRAAATIAKESIKIIDQLENEEID